MERRSWLLIVVGESSPLWAALSLRRWSRAIKKLAELEPKIEPASSVLPWFLLQAPALSSSPDFYQCWTGAWKCKANKPFLPQVAFVRSLFFTPTEIKLKQTQEFIELVGGSCSGLCSPRRCRKVGNTVMKYDDPHGVGDPARQTDKYSITKQCRKCTTSVCCGLNGSDFLGRVFAHLVRR